MSIEIIALYKLLISYKVDRTKAISKTSKHYYFKVCDLMTEAEFLKRVTKLIEKEEK